ncbi:MAG: LytTR family DNA-binding domain-containing protein [Coprobacillus sp.]
MMKINILEDQNINETEIIIKCKEKSDDIDKIIKLLEVDNHLLICKKDKDIFQVSIEDIMFIESVDEKTFVYLQDIVYENQSKIYELEEKLNNNNFIRISKSCLLNLDFLRSVRAIINGKYEATLLNGEKLVINRSYMNNFRKVFGI